MTSTAKRIWDKLRAAGMTEAAAAAMLGNIEKESGFYSNNLENRGNNNLKMTDEEYTAQVDSGEYGDFIYDANGYGLCQWTYFSRKALLLRFANNRGVSIGDENMQVDFIIYEMQTAEYASLWRLLCNTESIETANRRIVQVYERPANEAAAIAERYTAAMKWYGAFHGSEAMEELKKNETFWPPRTLTVGMEGNDVAVWQALMIARGYSCNITGSFDKLTREATLKFQTAAGLGADAIPGPLSWAEAVKF